MSPRFHSLSGARSTKATLTSPSRRRVALDLTPLRGAKFYGVIAASTLVGVGLVILDAVLGVMKKIRIPPLAVGIGIYLPMSATFAVIVGAVIWGVHMGATQGILSAVVADRAPTDLRGTAFGFFNLVTGVALLAASILAGGLWTAAGPSATFLAGAAISGVALASVLSVGPRRRSPGGGGDRGAADAGR